MQRGGLPHSIYGQLEFQLSGFAINTLRQGVETVLAPRLIALEKCYRSMFHHLCDQYVTGAFKAMELSGQDKNRMYFSEEITPETIRDAGDVEVDFIGQLPQDDMSKMSMAQIAREGETPLLPDIFIRDKILGLQSADSVQDTIRVQLAEKVLPEAQLWTLLQAAERQGRDDLVEFYKGELMNVFMVKGMERAQLMAQSQQAQGMAQGMGQGAPMPPQGGGPPGLPPQVMPDAALGVPPVPPTAPVGPSVPPGTPRPGGQSTQSRLENIGLVPPTGGA